MITTTKVFEGNREQFFDLVFNKFLIDHFSKNGYPKIAEIKDKIKFSCSLTSGTRQSKNGAIGLAWSPESSENGDIEIMISPVLSDSSRVIDVQIHEVVHAVVGNEHGHNHVFKRCAEKVGLTGKMTATIATDELKYKIAQWVNEIGLYPHSKLNLADRKKQSTRLIKYVCQDTALDPDTNKLERGYFNVRVTRGIVDEFGEPICPCCKLPMVEESEQIENRMKEIFEGETV